MEGDGCGGDVGRYGVMSCRVQDETNSTRKMTKRTGQEFNHWEQRSRALVLIGRRDREHIKRGRSGKLERDV